MTLERREEKRKKEVKVRGKGVHGRRDTVRERRDIYLTNI